MRISDWEFRRVLFRSLEVWANSLSLELSPLYGKAGSNAVRVAGEFPFRKHSATMWVDFVWVRARWSRYRQALVKRARDAGEDTRSEERRVGKECVVRVDLGGRRIIKKNNKENNYKENHKLIRNYK